MNRRGFFSLMAGAAGAALVPWRENVEPLIVLPPRFGWRPYMLSKGYMRVVEHYVINRDELIIRYDAVGRDIWGKEHQFHVDALKSCPEIATRLISDRFRQDGLIATHPQQATQFRLLLPRGVDTAYYV